MGPVQIATLSVLTLVFIVWAVEMFRFLALMSQRSRRKLDETGGGYFVWVGHSLSAYMTFLTSDKDRRRRRRILGITFLLVLSIAAQAVLMPVAP